MRILHPDSFGPEAETRVPCPCCGKGMVSPTRAAKAMLALKDEPEEMTRLITDIHETLPEKK